MKLKRPQAAQNTIFLIGIGIILCCAACSSQDSTEPVVESVLETQVNQLVRQQKIPGAVGVLVDHAVVVELHASGVRREGYPDTVTVNDLFHIGSIVKSMTATMIALLVDEGVLSWNTH
jgi:CubicO group peptidase (beta-lactamase class C family)